MQDKDKDLDKTLNAGSDAAMDALLLQMAKAKNTDSESFLEEMEALIDQAEEEEEEKIVPFSDTKVRRKLYWRAAAIAAVVMVLGTIALVYHSANSTGPMLASYDAQIIAHSAGTQVEPALEKQILTKQSLKAAPASGPASPSISIGYDTDYVWKGSQVEYGATPPQPSQAPKPRTRPESTVNATVDDRLATRHFLGGPNELQELNYRKAEPKQSVSEHTYGTTAYEYEALDIGASRNAFSTSGHGGTEFTAQAKKQNNDGILGGVTAEAAGAFFANKNESGVEPIIGREDSLAIRESTSSRYGSLIDNPWASPIKDPLSTFSIDVDTASWTNVRGLLNQGYQPSNIDKDSVRIEEWINYFDWDYAQPEGKHPFAFATEVASSPWNQDHLLLRIGVQGKEMSRQERPRANLVFLFDVSGSMSSANKLPLAKHAIETLTEELNADDKVTMVVYAGSEGLALPPTNGHKQKPILHALRNLNAGGSTNGGAGIKLAYRMAKENYIEDGVNRVILCTDGDFNVGTTSNQALVDLVESRSKEGVFLSVCGFGNDNLNDSMLEEITNKGNGNYYFIDSKREARKVFLEDLMGTLVTIAKDVKIQVEFNPAQVESYRLIGYANRKLNAEDFENDAIDAGEVGSGHSVTALYEIVPIGGQSKVPPELRYQKSTEPKRELVPSEELALLKLRYKLPDADTSIPMTQPIMPDDQSWQQASKDYRFAAAVAMTGMKLRGHDSVKNSSYADAVKIAKKAIGKDIHGHKAEFVNVINSLKP